MSFKLNDLNTDEISVMALRFVTVIRHHIESMLKGSSGKNTRDENAQLLLLSKSYDGLAFELSPGHAQCSSIKDAASAIRKQLIDKPIHTFFPWDQFQAFHDEYKKMEIEKSDSVDFLCLENAFRKFCADASLHCYLHESDRLVLSQSAVNLRGKNDTRALLAHGLALFENGDEAEGLKYTKRSFSLNQVRLIDGDPRGDLVDFIKAAITLYKHYDAQIEQQGIYGQNNARTILLNTMMVYPPAVEWELPYFSKTYTSTFNFDEPGNRIAKPVENSYLAFADMVKTPETRIIDELTRGTNGSWLTDKEKIKAYQSLAFYHYFTGNKDEAYAAAEKIIELTPRGLHVKSQLLKWDGHTKEAAACLVSGINRFDDPRLMVHSLSNIWRAEAQKHFDKGDHDSIREGMKLAFQAMQYNRMQKTGVIRQPINPVPANP